MKKIFAVLLSILFIPTISVFALDEEALKTRFDYNPFYQDRAAKIDVNKEIMNKKIKPAKISKQYHRLNNITSQYKKMVYETPNKMPKGVIVHSTAAGAKDNINNEITYMNRNWKNAFVHAFADYKEIIEVHNTDYYAWGAGPKANPYYIHIELVETGKTDEFIKSVNNQAYFVASKLREYNLKPSRAKKDKSGSIYAHSDVTKYLGGTDHGDPDGYFKKFNYSMDEFYKLVVYHYNQIKDEWTNTNKNTYHSNGKLKESLVEKKYKGKIVEKYHRKYNSNGVLTYKLTIINYRVGKSNVNEERNYKAINAKNNRITSVITRHYNDSLKLTKKEFKYYNTYEQVKEYKSYTYHPNGDYKQRVIKKYKRQSNGKNYIVEQQIKDKNNKGKFTAQTIYKYNKRGQLKSNQYGQALRYKYSYKNGKLKQRIGQKYKANGKINPAKSYKNYR